MTPPGYDDILRRLVTLEVQQAELYQRVIQTQDDQMKLEQEFHDFVKQSREEIKEMYVREEQIHREILQEIYVVNSTLSGYKRFLGGMGFVVTSGIATVTFLVSDAGKFVRDALKQMMK